MVVASQARLGDPLSIDRQRRAYLRRLRELNDLADTVEGFAATMAVEGAVLHLQADEPTGNLDSATTVEVLDLLRRFHAAGRTIVVVTHDERVATAAQRVVSLRDGRVVDETRLDRGTGRPLAVGDLVER